MNATEELRALASSLGLSIQHECGGYRVHRDHTNLFPPDGICPVSTKKECVIFLNGYAQGALAERKGMMKEI